MEFITHDQLKTHVYAGVSNAISKGDPTILQDAIDAAIGEAKGYLSRYDTEYIFFNPDDDPEYKKDPTLFMYVKTLAKWHFMQLANPNIDYEDAQTRYDRAILWLKDIQSGKVVMVDWKPAKVVEQSTFFHHTSNPKRRQHY